MPCPVLAWHSTVLPAYALAMPMPGTAMLTLRMLLGLRAAPDVSLRAHLSPHHPPPVHFLSGTPRAFALTCALSSALARAVCPAVACVGRCL
eukprot:2039955-Rhodomonas_salina.1